MIPVLSVSFHVCVRVCGSEVQATAPVLANNPTMHHNMYNIKDAHAAEYNMNALEISYYPLGGTLCTLLLLCTTHCTSPHIRIIRTALHTSSRHTTMPTSVKRIYTLVYVCAQQHYATIVTCYIYIVMKQVAVAA
jgi:hypothetical protein